MQRNGYNDARPSRVIVTPPPTREEHAIVNSAHDGERFHDQPVEGGVLRVFSPRTKVFIPEGDPRLSESPVGPVTDDEPTQTSSEVLDELLEALEAGEDIDEVLVNFLDAEDSLAFERALDDAEDE